MFNKGIFAGVILGCCSFDVSASHLDDTDGVLSNFKFDTVKFKSRTNCSLDQYPEVTKASNPLFALLSFKIPLK